MSEALAQAAQIYCGYPIPGGYQSQAEWGFGQPDLLGGAPAIAEGENRWPLRSLSKPFYSDSMIPCYSDASPQCFSSQFGNPLVG